MNGHGRLVGERGQYDHRRRAWKRRQRVLVRWVHRVRVELQVLLGRRKRVRRVQVLVGGAWKGEQGAGIFGSDGNVVAVLVGGVLG